MDPMSFLLKVAPPVRIAFFKNSQASCEMNIFVDVYSSHFVEKNMVFSL